ncbi:hypothetical protein GGR56DRAFT_627438 [Xylariaceae sp. FL0804]|nr:hypothetical protein GGR56DRAFT_627438 [Xylariaceae sp. FL0804]
MLKIASMALRGFLLLFGAVVLALSVTLAKQQAVGSPPTETSFSSFCGAFGILATLIGILAIFVEKVPAFGVMAVDGLASVFYLAGAIALTVALHPVGSCTSHSLLQRSLRLDNKLLNGGCKHEKGLTGLYCPNAGSGTSDSNGDNYTSGRCQRVQVDYVFEYLGFLFGVGIILTTFLLRRRGGGSRAYV